MDLDLDQIARMDSQSWDKQAMPAYFIDIGSSLVKTKIMNC